MGNKALRVASANQSSGASLGNARVTDNPEIIFRFWIGYRLFDSIATRKLSIRMVAGSR